MTGSFCVTVYEGEGPDIHEDTCTGGMPYDRAIGIFTALIDKHTINLVSLTHDPSEPVEEQIKLHPHLRNE